jgi:hypothetical protein
MILTWTTVYGLLTRWKPFRFIRVYTPEEKTKNILYAATRQTWFRKISNEPTTSLVATRNQILLSSAVVRVLDANST